MEYTNKIISTNFILRCVCVPEKMCEVDSNVQVCVILNNALFFVFPLVILPLQLAATGMCNVIYVAIQFYIDANTGNNSVHNCEIIRGKD